MVDQLADEYADRPVVFLEHAVDTAPQRRIDRWWAAYGSGGSVTLPLVMVDSGYRHSNGYEGFYQVYRAMVEDALARPAQAHITVERQRVGSAFRFTVRLTNLSGVTLGSGNLARLHAIVWEDAHVGDTDRFVRGATSVPIAALADGETGTFALEVALQGVNWDALHSVVLVDCRPGGAAGPYDMLQAVRQ